MTGGQLSLTIMLCVSICLLCGWLAWVSAKHGKES
jgi:hypothetical protein